jgi:hypothetical protein
LQTGRKEISAVQLSPEGGRLALVSNLAQFLCRKFYYAFVAESPAVSARPFNRYVLGLGRKCNDALFLRRLIEGQFLWPWGAWHLLGWPPIQFPKDPVGLSLGFAPLLCHVRGKRVARSAI